MSDMASQMAARMAEDGGAGLQPDDAGVVPGNEGGQTPTPTPPAAGPSTPESGAGAGPPDTIPYARFKEVNDRLSSLRGYEELRGLGYEPDSLAQLAAFETQYLHDPVGTWRAMAERLDLPQAVRDTIERELDGADPSAGSAGATPPAAVQPTPETSPEMQKVYEFIQRQEAREAEAAAQAAEAETDRRLDETVNHWTALDTQDGIETPEQVKLMAIAAAANSGTVFPTAQALAEAARSTIVQYRSSVLGGAVQRTGRGGSPPALPGSTPAPAGPVTFGGDIRAASRAAQAAIEEGRLPS